MPLDNTAVASAGDASVPSLEELGLPSAPSASLGQSQTTPPTATGGNATDQTNQKDQKDQKDQKSPTGQTDQTAPAAGSAPSLQDLGFTPGQTQSNAQLQATLDKRTHMLKVHQRLGLITAVPLLATVITGGQAKAKKSKTPGSTAIIEPSSANLDFHAALGGLTTGLYFATAYYAIRAPKIEGTKKRGAIRVHEALTYIHGPGMILTPILGIMAYNQENQGQKVHGVAAAHADVAWVTAAAYGAAIVAVSWPIKLKFWEK